MERKSSDQTVRPRRPSGAAIMRADVTEALTRAFFEEWARSGYAGLSLERVARTAGVGKAALYRRWPDKAAMVGDLLPKVGLTLTDVDDQGSLEADIHALLLAILRVLRHPKIRRILVDLHAEIDRTPALAQAIRPFQQARRSRINTLIERAIGRSDLPETLDRETAADLIAAPLYWRVAVLGGRADRRHVDRLAHMLAAALRAGAR